MALNLTPPDIRELKPRITVFGVGGAGGNAVNNMITAGLQGVDFVVANTDAQALTMSKAQRIVQMGTQVTQGLGAGSQPDVGAAAAQEVIDEIRDHLSGANMVFVTAGMGGGTGTGAAPVIAKTARDMGILTVGVVTKPFHFEGQRRMRTAEAGIAELHKVVDTLLIIPNQNLFRVANEKTTFADAFAMADQVLYSGVACITDLMVKEGLINLDFADVRAVMREMGKAMMGTGEASGEKRALTAAEAAIANPLIDDSSMKGARGLLDLDHRRQGPDAVRGRRSRDPHPRGSRPGRQHHRRRHLRRNARRRHPRLGGRHRHRAGADRAQRRAAGCDRDQRGRAGGRAGKPAGRPDRAAARRQCSGWPSAPRSWNAPPGCRRLRCCPAAPRARPARRARRAGGDRRGGRTGSPQPAQAPLQPASYGDVTVRPIAQKPSLFPDHDAAARRDRTSRRRRRPSSRRRPSGRRSARRGCRSSKICRCRRRTRSARPAATREEEHPQKTRMSLLQRLANVGLGRRDEETEPPIAARASGPAMPPMPPLPERKPQRSVAQQIAASEPVSEYARRPAPQGLDAHGRPAPVAAAPQGDDHLDIPAFLRRQAN